MREIKEEFDKKILGGGGAAVAGGVVHGVCGKLILMTFT